MSINAMRALSLFLMPLGLVTTVLLVGGVIDSIKRKSTIVRINLLLVTLLWAASTPAFSNWALGSLESEYPPKPISMLPHAEVAIVLGGAVVGAIGPRVETELTSSSDRVLHAMRLYRAGKIDRIIVSGGNSSRMAGDVPEANLIADLLVEWGVPGGHIEVAARSQNTFENAFEINALRQGHPFQSALLVTSAAHMPRAMAVFLRAGIPVAAAPTDIEVVSPRRWTPMLLVPDVGALAHTTNAVKEWLGYYYYRAMGYI